MLAITSPTSGGRSVGIVRSPTQAMEFSFFCEVQLLSLFMENENVQMDGLEQFVLILKECFLLD
jgi:hypothetical protein